MSCRLRRVAIFVCLMVLGLLLSQARPGLTAVVSASLPSLSPFGRSADQRIVQLSGQMLEAVGEVQGLDGIAQGQALYQAGYYAEAIAQWQPLLTGYQRRGDRLNQARIGSYLALAYQALGQPQEAAAAMAASLQQLALHDSDAISNGGDEGRAQVLTNAGNVLLSQGKASDALRYWQQAEGLYARLRHPLQQVQSQLNQAEALYELGFYQRAATVLTQATQSLQTLPASALKVTAQRRLGDLLRTNGQLDASARLLNESLATAEALRLTAEKAETLLSLGHTLRAQSDAPAARSAYQQALDLSDSLSFEVRAQLAQLSLGIAQADRALVDSLWPEILENLTALPPGQLASYGRIQLVESLMTWDGPHGPEPLDLAELLATTAKQAEDIGDRRAQTLALGRLGQLYEQSGQWAIATDLTERALTLAQVLNAPELAYQWKWQQGRILRQQGKRADAIAAYRRAVDHLSSLRGDLARASSEVQFSFEERIEPIYRQLVELLLTPEAFEPIGPEQLEQAREVIESLHLAELDNFFREACLDVQPVDIDQVDPQAAIFYPIALSDRLEVIVRLPGQPLRHFMSPVSQETVDALATQLRQALVVRSRRDYLSLSQQLYDWLIRPVARELEDSEANTLVFVPDRALQNLPMGSLFDGSHFLIEKYGIALTPGLKLLSPQAFSQAELKILAAGLSEGRQGFSPLSYVPQELAAIQTAIPQGEVLLNQAFTQASLVEELQTSSFPIVHIATHGQFSSKAEETFLLSWDNRINVREIDKALQQGSLTRGAAVELLVLSACETAAGDKRAALGIAGTAIRAGARSTLATLWSVNDEATAVLIGYFYQALTDPNITKAEALRQAQLQLLSDPQYRHPIYWAPYVLLGNWL